VHPRHDEKVNSVEDETGDVAKSLRKKEKKCAEFWIILDET
jgi:hypothetical protein